MLTAESRSREARRGEEHIPGCRLYVLTAAEAPVALVVRRGPSDWWHLLRWDLAKLTLEPGAWFRGTLYPRRSEISPDGRTFAYFALKRGSGYLAVSRVPWLKALAFWETLGTWTWGCRFAATGDLEIRAAMHQPLEPDRYADGAVTVAGMSTEWRTRDVWNELKRGWREAAQEPQYTLHHRRADGAILGMIHHGVDFRRSGMEGVQLEYFLQLTGDDLMPLADVQWADWDYQGRLLMATRAGALEIHECAGGKLGRIWRADLSGRTPDPQPAPDL